MQEHFVLEAWMVHWPTFSCDDT